MSSVKKVNPAYDNIFKHIYAIISGLNKKEYEDLTLDKFLECRDSVYIIQDKPSCHGIPDFIIGIIACRRTNLKETDIPKLPYYCQPSRMIYSIECLHVFEYYDEDVHRAIVKLLLEVCAKDKNDGFISIKISKASLKDYIREELEIQGYYQEFYKDGIYTFIKRPTVQK